MEHSSNHTDHGLASSWGTFFVGTTVFDIFADEHKNTHPNKDLIIMHYTASTKGLFWQMFEHVRCCQLKLAPVLLLLQCKVARGNKHFALQGDSYSSLDH